jgi:hypothetical protein
MKLYATTINEKGKKVGVGGNECLDVDVMVGNIRLAALTVRRADLSSEGIDGEGWALVDQDDNILFWIEDKGTEQTVRIEPCGHKRDSGECSECLPF